MVLILYFTTCANYYSQYLGQKNVAADQNSSKFSDNEEWKPKKVTFLNQRNCLGLFQK